MDTQGSFPFLPHRTPLGAAEQVITPLPPPPSAVPAAKRVVCPPVEFRWPQSESDCSDSSDAWSLLRSPADQLVGGGGGGGAGTAAAWGVVTYRPRRDYAVRRAFLTSYHFSVRESFWKRTGRAMRELGADAVAALRGVPGRAAPRRMASALWRGLHLSSSLRSVRCFTGGRGCVLL